MSASRLIRRGAAALALAGAAMIGLTASSMPAAAGDGVARVIRATAVAMTLHASASAVPAEAS